MSLVEQAIITDTANLTVILLGIGLIAGQVLRRWDRARLTPLPWRMGRVATSRFDVPELVMALALIGLLYFSVWLEVREQDLPKAITDAWRSLGGLAYMIAVLLILILLAIVRRHDLVELWGLKRMDTSKLWLTAGMLVLSTVVTLGSMHLFYTWVLRDLVGKPPAQDSIEFLRANRSAGVILAMVFNACLIFPLLEEVLFRGFLYPALKRFVQPTVAALVVSGIFAAVHTNLGGLLPLGVLSLLLILAYELSGSLLVPIFVHSGFNLCNILLTLAESSNAPAGDG